MTKLIKSIAYWGDEPKYTPELNAIQIHEHDYNPITDKLGRFYTFSVYYGGRDFPNLSSGYFRSRVIAEKSAREFAKTNEAKYIWGTPGIN